VALEVESAYHQFELPDRTRWSDVIIKTSIFGAQIAKALSRFEQANSDTRAGIFDDAAWANKERPSEPSLVALLNGCGEPDAGAPY